MFLLKTLVFHLLYPLPMKLGRWRLLESADGRRFGQQTVGGWSADGRRLVSRRSAVGQQTVDGWSVGEMLCLQPLPFLCLSKSRGYTPNTQQYL